MKENLTERKMPRFHPSVAIPDVPKGKELHKYYGQPVLLTAKEECEPMFGNSPYTERQVKELGELSGLMQGIDPESSIAQALREAFSARQVSAMDKIPNDGVLLIPDVPVEVRRDAAA